MLLVKIAFSLLVGMVLSTMVVLGYRILYVNQLQSQFFIPQPLDFSFEPPSQSMSLSMVDIMGNVTKLNRQKQTIPLVTGSLLIQGESIQTDATSAAKIALDDMVAIEIGFGSSVGTVNLIPDQLTFNQEKGEVRYVVLDSSKPITIRALHALVKVASGSATMIVEPNMNRISFGPVEGVATMAYQDKDHNTYVVDLPLRPGEIYHDDARMITKPKRYGYYK